MAMVKNDDTDCSKTNPSWSATWGGRVLSFGVGLLSASLACAAPGTTPKPLTNTNLAAAVGRGGNMVLSNNFSLIWGSALWATR
jgi:hypothetical protein